MASRAIEDDQVSVALVSVPATQFANDTRSSRCGEVALPIALAAADRRLTGRWSSGLATQLTRPAGGSHPSDVALDGRAHLSGRWQIKAPDRRCGLGDWALTSSCGMASGTAGCTDSYGASQGDRHSDTFHETLCIGRLWRGQNLPWASGLTPESRAA